MMGEDGGYQFSSVEAGACQYIEMYVYLFICYSDIVCIVFVVYSMSQKYLCHPLIFNLSPKDETREK